MMKGYVSSSAALLFFVILITTIDTSRIFYPPLPKLHSSRHIFQSSLSSNVHGLAKKKQENNFGSDGFIPPSALERFMNTKEVDSARRETFDWSTLVNEDSFQQSARDDPNVASDTISQLDDNQVGEPWAADSADSRIEHLQSDDILDDSDRRKRRNDALFLAIVATCSIVGILGLIAAAIFWYKIQQRAQAAYEAEYPSYGITGPYGSGSKVPPSSTTSDRKLAQSAQMFHYQQQRQQMMAQEKANLDTKPVHSDDSDDEAPAGGDYTVYECPGLAPTGEMEVRNPLFAEPDSAAPSSTSASHPTTNNHYPQLTSLATSSSPPKEKPLP